MSLINNKKGNTMTTPTMDKMLKAYVDAAAIERMKCGRPEKGTVKNTKQGVKRFVRGDRSLRTYVFPCGDPVACHCAFVDFVLS